MRRPTWLIVLAFVPFACVLIVGLRMFFRPRWPADTGKPGVPARGAGGKQLAITFWNVEWFPGQHPNAGEAVKAAHVAAVVPVVERLDPDVLGLEEVSDRDGARLITDHLKGFHIDVCTKFTRAPANGPSLQQTVLCSRLPTLASGWENWQPGADGVTPRRGFAFAVYQPAPGDILIVYGVHLKSNVPDEPGGAAANTAMREESARQLLVHERAMTVRYAKAGRVRLTVVGGDMNTSLDDTRFGSERTLHLLMEGDGFRWGWDGVPLERRYTLPGEGRYPAVCFDHIFYRASSGGGVRLLDCAVEPTGRAESDHRPVTARFAW